MPKPTEISEALLEPLARAAYAFWRERAMAGPPSARQQGLRHESVPHFDELSEFQRDQIGVSISLRGLHDELESAVEAALSWRELKADDLEVGTRVRLRGPHDDDAEIGKVVDWVLANPKSGRLDSIRVHWDSGEVLTYPPSDVVLADGD